MEPDVIVVHDAYQHNLQHIDVTIPRHKLVVVTGVSGSGKSSLAFDTIYAEAQRRYAESLSVYVRQFFSQMEKPQVGYIEGLSPAVAIAQRSFNLSPRTTVGTLTDVIDYLRVLFAVAGKLHCPRCGREIQPTNARQITRSVSSLRSGTQVQLLAPVVRQRKGSHAYLLQQAQQDGYTHARINGENVDLRTQITLDKKQTHSIDLVIDEFAVLGEHDEHHASFLTRLDKAVRTALQAGNGSVIVRAGEDDELILSEHNACVQCGISLPKLTPQLFNWNTPLGMCIDCTGLGTLPKVDPDLFIHDVRLSLLDGAIRWYGPLRQKLHLWEVQLLRDVVAHYGGDLETAWQELPERVRQVLLYGSGEEKIRFVYQSEREDGLSGERVIPFEGLVPQTRRRYRETNNESMRQKYAAYMRESPCLSCGGSRLCAAARAVTVDGKTLREIEVMPLREALAWIKQLMGATGPMKLTSDQLEISLDVLKVLHDRLSFLCGVGLYYLTLDRVAATLSAGEEQRVRLATQIGCGLVGVLYVLDEPSVGLHPRDTQALLKALLRLRDMGNTVLVVEHDPEIIRGADWVIDMGPGAGVLGGHVVASGTPNDIVANPRSLTGRYLAGTVDHTAPYQQRQRELPTRWITMSGARHHNLKNVTAQFPLGRLTCVTGVSGSGKSSLVIDTLYPAAIWTIHNVQSFIGGYDWIDGLDQLDKVINISQEPIGRTPRSIPATYVEIFDEIREIFAATPEAQARKFKASHFSFNVKGGRCEACEGYGQQKVEMHFLADAWIQCPECSGTRFGDEVLMVHYRGKTIAQVLDFDVHEALEFFADHPKIARVLQTLHDVGLDYLKLGQSAMTLSGGEAQRVRLARELSKVSTGRTLYILDEPTVGLHFADVQHLLAVLHRLVDAGNTVIVIEHNLDVIRTADWIIDMGPEGGDAGGMIIAQGPPVALAGNPASVTGAYLLA